METWNALYQYLVPSAYHNLDILGTAPRFGCIPFGVGFNPTNPDLIDNYELLQYLRGIRDSRKTRKIYGRLSRFLDERYRITGLTTDDIQYLCNILGDVPELFAQFTEFLPSNHRFTLSQDYEHTRLVLITQDEKTVVQRAAFGLIDADISRQRSRSADTHILYLLSTALRQKEREEAVLTLCGGDAQRALQLMQSLVEFESSWSRFVRLVGWGEISKFGGGEWQQMRKLRFKLSAYIKQVPSPLHLKGLHIDHDYVEPSECADLLFGQYKGTKVVVKRLRVFNTVSGPKHALQYRELLFEGALSWKKLRHPRILPFLGLDDATFPHTCCLVYPWVRRGNMRDCIQTLREQGKSIPREKWMREVIEGLLYLQRVGILHGALRGTNVLIGEDYGAMLVDFDLNMYYLSMAYKTDVGKSTFSDTTPRWYAPEIWKDDIHRPDDLVPAHLIDPYEACRRVLSHATDVYAFGCLCIEIYSGKDPQFPGLPSYTDDEWCIIPEAVLKGDRPIRPEELKSDRLWSLIQRCWSEQPSGRPTIQELSQQLPQVFL